MPTFNGGAEFHGEFSSADASGLSEANSRFALYAPGAVAALTLASTDLVVITHVTFSSGGTTLTCQVYSGADATVDAGEELFGGIVLTNTTVINPFNTVPAVCRKGTYPKVKTSGAGAVRVQIKGYIVGV